MYLLVQPQHLQSLQASSISLSILVELGTHGKFTKTGTRSSVQITLNTQIHRGYVSWAGSTPKVMASMGPQCLWNSDPTLLLKHTDLCSSRYSLQSTSKNNDRPRVSGVPETTPQGKGRRWNGVTIHSHPAPQLWPECGAAAAVTEEWATKNFPASVPGQ